MSDRELLGYLAAYNGEILQGQNTVAGQVAQILKKTKSGHQCTECADAAKSAGTMVVIEGIAQKLPLAEVEKNPGLIEQVIRQAGGNPDDGFNLILEQPTNNLMQVGPYLAPAPASGQHAGYVEPPNKVAQEIAAYQAQSAKMAPLVADLYQLRAFVLPIAEQVLGPTIAFGNGGEVDQVTHALKGQLDQFAAMNGYLPDPHDYHDYVVELLQQAAGAPGASAPGLAGGGGAPIGRPVEKTPDDVDELPAVLREPPSTAWSADDISRFYDQYYSDSIDRYNSFADAAARVRDQNNALSDQIEALSADRDPYIAQLNEQTADVQDRINDLRDAKTKANLGSDYDGARRLELQIAELERVKAGYEAEQQARRDANSKRSQALEAQRPAIEAELEMLEASRLFQVLETEEYRKFLNSKLIASGQAPIPPATWTTTEMVDGTLREVVHRFDEVTRKDLDKVAQTAVRSYLAQRYPGQALSSSDISAIVKNAFKTARRGPFGIDAALKSAVDALVQKRLAAKKGKAPKEATPPLGGDGAAKPDEPVYSMATLPAGSPTAAKQAGRTPADDVADVKVDEVQYSLATVPPTPTTTKVTAAAMASASADAEVSVAIGILTEPVYSLAIPPGQKSEPPRKGGKDTTPPSGTICCSTVLPLALANLQTSAAMVTSMLSAVAGVEAEVACIAAAASCAASVSVKVKASASASVSITTPPPPTPPTPPVEKPEEGDTKKTPEQIKQEKEAAAKRAKDAAETAETIKNLDAEAARKKAEDAKRAQEAAAQSGDHQLKEADETGTRVRDEKTSTAKGRTGGGTASATPPAGQSSASTPVFGLGGAAGAPAATPGPIGSTSGGLTTADAGTSQPILWDPLPPQRAAVAPPPPAMTTYSPRNDKGHAAVPRTFTQTEDEAWEAESPSERWRPHGGVVPAGQGGSVELQPRDCRQVNLGARVSDAFYSVTHGIGSIQQYFNPEFKSARVTPPEAVRQILLAIEGVWCRKYSQREFEVVDDSVIEAIRQDVAAAVGQWVRDQGYEFKLPEQGWDVAMWRYIAHVADVAETMAMFAKEVPMSFIRMAAGMLELLELLGKTAIWGAMWAAYIQTHPAETLATILDAVRKGELGPLKGLLDFARDYDPILREVLAQMCDYLGEMSALGAKRNKTTAEKQELMQKVTDTAHIIAGVIDLVAQMPKAAKAGIGATKAVMKAASEGGARGVARLGLETASSAGKTIAKTGEAIVEAASQPGKTAGRLLEEGKAVAREVYEAARAPKKTVGSVYEGLTQGVGDALGTQASWQRRLDAAREAARAPTPRGGRWSTSRTGAEDLLTDPHPTPDVADLQRRLGAMDDSVQIAEAKRVIARLGHELRARKHASVDAVWQNLRRRPGFEHLERSHVDEMFDYLFDSNGIALDYPNIKAWDRIAEGGTTIDDLRFVKHEMEELQALRNGGLSDPLGRVPADEVHKWRDAFVDKHYPAAHQKALDAELRFMSDEVARKTKGSLKLSPEEFALSDKTRTEAATYTVRDGVPMRDHPDAAFWDRSAERHVLPPDVASSLGLPPGKNVAISDIIAAIKRGAASE